VVRLAGFEPATFGSGGRVGRFSKSGLNQNPLLSRLRSSPAVFPAT